MKKRFVSTLAIAMIGLYGSTFAGTIPKVYLNGNKLFVQKSPVNESNIAYVPLRTIESLGAKVSWDDKTQTAIIKHGINTIEQRIGSDTARVNSKIVNIPTPAIKRNGTTYIPVKFVSEVLGAKIEFDKKENAIYISHEFKDDEVLEFDSFGRLIKTGKAPLGNSKEFSNYTVLGVNEEIYKHPLSYNSANWKRTPKEGTNEGNTWGSDFIRPKNMYMYSRYNEKNLAEWVDTTEKYLNLTLNVDYRTIDDSWAYELATTLYQDTSDEYFQKYLDDTNKYKDYIVKNKIIIEGDYYVEPSTAYNSSGLISLNVWAKYKANKDFVFNEIAQYDKKGNKWYEGYTKIELGNNIADNDGSDLCIRGSYLGTIGEK